MRATVLVLAVLAFPGAAGASDVIRRCQAADGTTVYTDKPCAELDARPLAAPEPIAPRTEGAGAGSRIERRAPGSTMDRGGAVSLGGTTRDDCIRRTDTLLFEIRAAIESRNVNRLAGVYDWAGKDSGAAGAILERLGRLADRPLATVEFRYPEADYFAEPTTLSTVPAPATVPVSERPVGVRIVQQAPGDLAPVFEADLRLVRNAGCWWVSF